MRGAYRAARPHHPHGYLLVDSLTSDEDLCDDLLPIIFDDLIPESEDLIPIFR